MINGRYWQLIAGNFVASRSNWERRPSNGKQHDDNYMEGYLGNFRTFGKLISYSTKCSTCLCLFPFVAVCEIQ